MREHMFERFVPLTKALYNSVLGGIELALPMILDDHERMIVSHKGATIVIGRSGTGKTTALIYKMRAIDQACRAQNEGQIARQMFVTRSKVLAQHVESTYQGLIESTDVASKSLEELKALAKKARENPDRALVEFDTEVDLRTDLPTRFTELQDSHFPLFVSFDKLSSLIEGDIRHQWPDRINNLESRSIIRFDDFLHSYWPSFRRDLTNSLEPNLVFCEIIGVIKGSQAALESNEGYLTYDTYVNQLSRRQFPLMVPARSRIYKIFELYTKHKSSRFDIDEADRTRTIFRNMEIIVKEKKVDYLFVDEVQDNLMIDIHFLRAACKEIENIYWSGDSAQTVVAGSSFRINDLKAFMYRDQSANLQGHIPKKSPAKFTTFELSVNFRSLSGVVEFAGSVVQKINELFPECIDTMKPESARETGPHPIIFTDIKNEDRFFEDFLLGSSAANRVVFGAQQAILVRDDNAADQLDTRLQGLCNVLTIMDSKGLEFDDVLLYNFFSCSVAPIAAWKFIVNKVAPIGSQVEHNHPPAPPVLCSELKLLYVAITRARRRCWIWDSGELIDALKIFWAAHKLVETESANSMVGRLAVSTNKSQWIEKGREYFSHRLYKLAAACFTQAEKFNEARLSRAYHQMSRAKLKRGRGDTPDTRTGLLLAAEELEKCAQLHGIGDPRNVYFHAGTCFEASQKTFQAATSFAKAGNHEHALHLLFDTGDYNHGIDLLLDLRGQLDTNLYEQFLENGRRHCFNQKLYPIIPRLFDLSVDDQIAYAKKHSFRTQLKHILKANKRYNELSEIYSQEGDLNQSVLYGLNAFELSHDTESLQRAIDRTIAIAEPVTLLEGRFRKQSYDQAKALLEMVQPFSSDLNNEMGLYIDLLFSALSLNQVGLHLAHAWDGEKGSGSQRSLLARYLALKDTQWLQTNSLDSTLGYLDIWKSYNRDILELVQQGRSSQSNVTQALFGFAPVQPMRFADKSTFKISRDSLLYAGNDSEDQGQIESLLRNRVPDVLRKRVYDLHLTLLESPSFQLPILNSQVGIMPSQTSASALIEDHLVNSCLKAMSRSLHVLRLTTAENRKSIVQSWLRKLFQAVRPMNGEVRDLSKFLTITDSDASTDILIQWLRYYSQIVFAEDQHSARSDALITIILGSALFRSAYYIEPASMVSNRKQENQFPRRVFVKDLMPLFEGTGRNRLTEAMRVIESLLELEVTVEADILTTIIEYFIREILFHIWVVRRNTGIGFSGLLVPASWAEEITRNHASDEILPEIPSPYQYLRLIESFSESLRFGLPGRWKANGRDLDRDGIQILNLRLCWCVALAFLNLQEGYDINLRIRRTFKGLTNDRKPAQYQHRHITAAAPHRFFASAEGPVSCLYALWRTLHHENLAVLSHDQSQTGPVPREVYSVQTASYKLVQCKAMAGFPVFCTTILSHKTIKAAQLIQKTWTKYRARRSTYPRSMLEQECHHTYERLQLSVLYDDDKSRLHLIRGPILNLSVAVEWLGRQIGSTDTRFSRRSIFGLVFSSDTSTTETLKSRVHSLQMEINPDRLVFEDRQVLRNLADETLEVFSSAAASDLLLASLGFDDIRLWVRESAEAILG